MSLEKKFCPNCGEELPVEMQFCSSCGFDFEKREVPVEEVEARAEAETITESSEPEATEETVEASESKGFSMPSFDFSNIDFKNFDVKQVTNQQWALLGGVVLAIIVLFALLFSGNNVSIAGTYENEYTITELDETNTITISRNGKTEIEETKDDMYTKMTFYIKEYEYGPEYTPSVGSALSDLTVYQPDYAKDIELEIVIPEYILYSEPDSLYVLEFLASSFDFKLTDVDGGKRATGKLTASAAEMLDLDYLDLMIEEDPRGIVFDYDLYLER